MENGKKINEIGGGMQINTFFFILNIFDYMSYVHVNTLDFYYL